MTTLDDLLTQAQYLAQVQARVDADRARFAQGLTNSTDWQLGHALLARKEAFGAALDAYIDLRVQEALIRYVASMPTAYPR